MSKTRESPIVNEDLAGSVVGKTVPSGETLEKQVSGAFQEVEESSQNRSSAVKDSLDTSSAIDRDISTGLKLSADFAKAQVDASEVFDDKTGNALLSMNGKEGADSIYLPAGLAAAAATADLPKADVDDTQEIALESDTVTSSSTSSSKTSYLFLKQAVERGDWRAVGQAAAIMNSAVSTAPTSLDSYSRQQSLYLEKEDRIKQLDDLIASGDWLSVLIVAGQYEAMDRDFALE
eukprot:scaffold21396_cov68-Cyclotella_meneghiniana.AAC.2